MAGNKQILVVGRPTAMPQAEDFSIVDGDVPVVGDGQLLVRRWPSWPRADAKCRVLRRLRNPTRGGLGCCF